MNKTKKWAAILTIVCVGCMAMTLIVSAAEDIPPAGWQAPGTTAMPGTLTLPDTAAMPGTMTLPETAAAPQSAPYASKQLSMEEYIILNEEAGTDIAHVENSPSIGRRSVVIPSTQGVGPETQVMYENEYYVRSDDGTVMTAAQAAEIAPYNAQAATNDVNAANRNAAPNTGNASAMIPSISVVLAACGIAVLKGKKK